MMKKFMVLLSALFLVSLLAVPVFALEVGIDVPTETFGLESYESTDRPAEADTYGTASWIELNIPTEGFVPLSDAQWTHLYTGWSYKSAGTNTGHCAPVHLPSGALVSGVTTWTDDTNATYNITYEFIMTDLTTNTGTTIFSWSSSGTPGIQRQYRSFTAPFTIGNDRISYTACIFHGTTGTSLLSAGITFWYHLQVSPAPATATFGDVPTTHPFFQYIEALVDSGITSGCGGGNYCPDAPVTRGQMAVFLSRALGLHWGDL